MADEQKNNEETEATPEAEETPEVEETTAEAPAGEPATAEPEETPEVEKTTAEAPAEEPAAAEPEQTPEVAEPAAAAPAGEQPVAEPEAPKRSKKRLPRSERHKHSKPAREKPAKRKRITRTAKPETTPAARQERRGVVVSDKGEKTIVVQVDVTKLHPKYKKVVRRKRKFHAHDEQNTAGVGDVVRIVESRPLSKTKNWRLAEIVQKAR
jgi:small subunit ribosomal protein S17